MCNCFSLSLSLYVHSSTKSVLNSLRLTVTGYFNLSTKGLQITVIDTESTKFAFRRDRFTPRKCFFLRCPNAPTHFRRAEPKPAARQPSGGQQRLQHPGPDVARSGERSAGNHDPAFDPDQRRQQRLQQLPGCQHTVSKWDRHRQNI